jgi:hypothetical protein
VETFFQEVTSPRDLINLAIPKILKALDRLHREGHLSPENRETCAAFYAEIATGRMLVYRILEDQVS